jgi:hypothetical protein
MRSQVLAGTALWRENHHREHYPDEGTDLLAKLTPAVKQQLAVESALDGFAKAHKDIVNDPHLAQLADGFLIEVQREQPDKPFGDQLEAAAERCKAGSRTRVSLPRRRLHPAQPLPAPRSWKRSA